MINLAVAVAIAYHVIFNLSVFITFGYYPCIASQEPILSSLLENNQQNELDNMIRDLKEEKLHPSKHDEIFPTQYGIQWEKRIAVVSVDRVSGTKPLFSLKIDSQYGKFPNLAIQIDMKNNIAYINNINAGHSSISGSTSGVGTWLVKFSNFILCNVNVTHSHLLDASNFFCEIKPQNVVNGTKRTSCSSKLIRMSQEKFSSWYHQFGYYSYDRHGMNMNEKLHNKMKLLNEYDVIEWRNQVLLTYYYHTEIDKQTLFDPTLSNMDKMVGAEWFVRVMKETIPNIIIEHNIQTVGELVDYLWQNKMCHQISKIAMWIEFMIFHNWDIDVSHFLPAIQRIIDRENFGNVRDIDLTSLKLWNYIVLQHRYLQNHDNQCNHF